MVTESNLNFTEHMDECIKTSFEKELSSFYTREDFQDVLNKLDNAKNDNKLFIERYLKNMCDARDLDLKDLEKDFEHGQSLLDQIPTREELLRELVQMFYKNYNKWKSPEDFMTRIVRRLAPEYKNDTVRTAILKKFILGAGFQWKDGKREGGIYKTERVINWARNRFSSDEKTAYDNCSDQNEQLQKIVEKLDDSIFDEIIQNDLEPSEKLKLTEPSEKLKLTNKEYFHLIVRALNNWIEKKLEVTTDKKKALDYNKNLLSLDEVPMICLDDITFDDAEKLDDAIRGFYKENGLVYSDQDSNIGKLNQILSVLEENALPERIETESEKKVFDLLKKEFDIFKTRTRSINTKGEFETITKLFENNYVKDAKKKKQNKIVNVSADQNGSDKEDWEILRLCDNYAKGTFRNEGGTRNTRIFLYYFAFMFDMTVKKSEKDEPDPERDVDKNLFQDYYNDNVMRYLKETEASGEDLEAEPLGDGINYKNYAETIYMYFLCKRELASNAGESIDMAEELIRDCFNEAFEEFRMVEERKAGRNTAREDYTEYFRKAYFYEALNKEKRDLLNYILKYYTVYVPNQDIGKKMSAASEQVSAFEYAKWVLDEVPFIGNYEKHFNKQLDYKSLKDEKDWLWVIPDLLENDPNYSEYKKDESFMDIVVKLNTRMKTKPFLNLEDKKISRNACLSLFLNAYIHNMEIKKIKNIDSNLKGEKFPDVYDAFRKEADIWLEYGRFQTFKATNLVDLYAFITFYAYMVKNYEIIDLNNDLDLQLKEKEMERGSRGDRSRSDEQEM